MKVGTTGAKWASGALLDSTSALSRTRRTRGADPQW